MNATAHNTANPAAAPAPSFQVSELEPRLENVWARDREPECPSKDAPT